MGETKGIAKLLDEEPVLIPVWNGNQEMARAGPRTRSVSGKTKTTRNCLELGTCVCSNMSDIKERHWNSLVVTLQHGQCVLVLGPEIPAEIAQSAGSPEKASVTEALTQLLADQLKAESLAVTGTTLAAVAQQFEDANGVSLRSEAFKFYTTSSHRPSILHRRLARLPFNLVITTSHDALLAEAMRSPGEDSSIQKKEPNVYRYHFRGDRRENPEFPLSMSPDTPIIYHLFGDAGEPASLVLSENDLLDFLVAVVSGRPSLPNCLRRALRQTGQNFLFVGFGIRHWYLRVLLKVLVRTLELHRSGTSFALEPLQSLSDVDRNQTVLFYQRGTRVEVLDVDVDKFLDELGGRFQLAGGRPVQAIRTKPRPKVFISYASEDANLAARLFGSLLKEQYEPLLDSDFLDGGDDWNKRVEDQLRETDYVLLLHSDALSRKHDSYVNKEIALAQDRGKYVRGKFLLPLLINNLPNEQWVTELGQYQQLPLREEHYDEDISEIVRTICRDYQVRMRS